MEWQPIETASYADDDVLLWDGSRIYMGSMRRNGDWWVEGGQITCEPTHWMPLPEPPK